MKIDKPFAVISSIPYESDEIERFNTRQEAEAYLNTKKGNRYYSGHWLVEILSEVD